MIPAALIIAAFAGQLAGPSEIAAIAGHGGLTAGIDHNGVLAVLRWPNPGGPDQVLQPRPGTIDGGGRWGIQVGNETYWVGDASSSAIEVAQLPSGLIRASIAWLNSDLRATVHSGMVSDLPVFVTTIDVTGLDAAPVILWRSEWAPRIRNAAELPFGDGPFDRINGFASITEPAHVWHVRPSEPDRELLRAARDLVARAAPIDEWAALIGEGIWIVITNRGAAPLENESGAVAQSGPIASQVEPNVDPVTFPQGKGYSAHVVIAAGESHAAVLATLSEINSRSSLSMRRPMLPDRIRKLVGDQRYLPARCWHTLQALRDPQTGRVIRGLSVDPPLARDWPRHGAWIALAFDAAGDTAAAQTILDHYLAAVRDSDAPGQPFGSLPESFYTNGELASPRFIVDDLGPARILFAVRRVALSMPADARELWLTRRAESIAAAAEFLVSWVDPRQGAPLWSPDPVALSDPETQTRVFDHLAGVNAAIELTRALDKPVPDHWVARRDRLRKLVERIVTTPSTGWSPARAVLWDVEGLPPELLNAVRSATRTAVNTRAAQSASEFANLALQAALVPDDSAIRDLAFSQIAEAVLPPDAEFASRVLIAALARPGP